MGTVTEMRHVASIQWPAANGNTDVCSKAPIRTSASNLLYFVASRCLLASRAATSDGPPPPLPLPPAAKRGTSRAAVAISPSTRSVTCRISGHHVIQNCLETDIAMAVVKGVCGSPPPLVTQKKESVGCESEDCGRLWPFLPPKNLFPAGQQDINAWAL